MKPRIPMSPGQLPRQRLYVVTDMPPRPAHFLTRCDYGFSDVPEFQPPPRKPSRAHLVCMLEWAWSPAHNRLTAYYLCRNRTRSHWMLWSSSPAEDYWYGSRRWESHLVAYGPRRGVDLHTAAAWLLHDSLKFEMEDGCTSYTDFWIDSTGVLSVDDIKAVKRALNEVEIPGNP